MLKRSIFAMMILLMAVSGASAQNMLVNPGFEDGATGGVPPTVGWSAFGNAYQEATSTVDYRFVPNSGNNLCSMYGNFWGSFNVTGVFQEFPAIEGQEFKISSYTRHWGGDAMIGSQATGGNWVVQKIAFFNAGGTEIGAAEAIILDGSFAQDVWHYSGETHGIAPVGTATVQALILYLQPLWDGGACNIDDVSFELVEGAVATEEATWGAIKDLGDE
ncbi:MAG TPA: hypothetical protein VLA34_08575 [Candidatus Krumholzibacterium sp.]|nr:hypothetical protein [Candidatus Krumholzibacterium sp.]